MPRPGRRRAVSPSRARYEHRAFRRTPRREYRRPRNRAPGHREQSRFDFGRVDVDAAGDHHVAGAVADKEIAVLVEIADIAERDETVAPDLATLFVLAVVGEIGKPLEPEINLADLPRRQNPAVGTVDAHRAAKRRSANGTGLSQRFLGGVEGGDSGLGR